MGILEKIKDIEHEIARTQKNKATEYHLGLLKAKLAKFRTELMDGNKGGGGKGEGFDVMKSGDARVALIGFPSVGKSTLLSTLTNTHSEQAAYEFTTLTCVSEDVQVMIHGSAPKAAKDLTGDEKLVGDCGQSVNIVHLEKGRSTDLMWKITIDNLAFNVTDDHLLTVRALANPVLVLSPPLEAGQLDTITLAYTDKYTGLPKSWGVRHYRLASNTALAHLDSMPCALVREREGGQQYPTIVGETLDDVRAQFWTHFWQLRDITPRERSKVRLHGIHPCDIPMMGDLYEMTPKQLHDGWKYLCALTQPRIASWKVAGDASNVDAKISVGDESVDDSALACSAVARSIVSATYPVAVDELVRVAQAVNPDLYGIGRPLEVQPSFVHMLNADGTVLPAKIGDSPQLVMQMSDPLHSDLPNGGSTILQNLIDVQKSFDGASILLADLNPIRSEKGSIDSLNSQYDEVTLQAMTTLLQSLNSCTSIIACGQAATRRWLRDATKIDGVMNLREIFSHDGSVRALRFEYAPSAASSPSSLATASVSASQTVTVYLCPQANSVSQVDLLKRACALSLGLTARAHEFATRMAAHPNNVAFLERPTKIEEEDQKYVVIGVDDPNHRYAIAHNTCTHNCIPGVIEYKDARIQLLDLPGIIEGAAKGKGRGRQVIGVARTSDLVVMMLDAGKAEIQKELLRMELDAVGIRINQRKPNVTIKNKKTGGVSVTSTCGDLTHIDVHQARNILQLYKRHNCDILIREDITVDEFIDVIEGNRVYLRCLYVINKIDAIHLDEVDRLAHAPDTVVISCHDKLNLDLLLDKIWEGLNFIRIYTKPRGKRPDFNEPLIMRNGSGMEHVCHAIHREMVKHFKYALVWGTSAKHQPQRVGINHSCEDEDVVQIMVNQ